MALNFRLFNCDRTFSLDKVEALIQRVAAKLSRETKIEKTYFPLPRMKDLCEELEKEDSHFEYAVFVVHAHESRLSINEKNAGIGYAKVYRALQKVTGDRVLVVIGGDDNYKDQGERDKSVLSRWVWHKICSQFTEDYVNGVKGFIFSWEENHHPIHEEALEFYLDPTKRGTQFVPRPKPPPAKIPEQAKLSEVKKQEPQPAERKKFLEKEFPPKRNENRPQPSRPETSTKHMTDPLQKENQKLESQAGPYQAGPYQAGPYQAGQSQAGQSQAGPYQAGPYQAGQSQAGPYQAGPYQAGQSQAGQSQAGQSQAGQSQAGQSQAGQSQAGQSQAKQASAISGTPNVHILSFLASQPSVGQVVNVFEVVYKQLSIASKPKSSTDQINIQDHIMKHKPEYLVLVSDFDNIEDILNFDKQVQRYKEIVKKSSSVGTKLTFIITEDKEYREGDMCSDAVHSIFTKLNQDIPSSEQLLVMSWTKTPWATHKDALAQLLTPYGKVRAVSQQYGATKQDPTSGVPCTQSEDVPIKRHFYRASISYGRVVQVLESDPLGWEPETRDLNIMLMKYKSKKKAIFEFWVEGDGRGLQSVVRTCEAKLYKIAEGLATDKMYSILVYSYHVEGETNDVSNFIHHLGVHVLLPCQPIDPTSLMHEIKGNKPDYVMFSADIHVLKDDDKVKKLIREHGTRIRDIIENNIGQGVIIMLFGDKYNEQGEILASKEATQCVRKLTKGIVEPDRLTVMTCQNRPYTTHQNWMKELLKPKNISFEACRDPDKGLLRYKADVVFGQVHKVSHIFPQDWQPEEFILKDVLEKSKKEEKVTLEFWEDKNGQINPIVTAHSKGGFSLPSIPNPFQSIPNPFSSRKKKIDKSDVV